MPAEIEGRARELLEQPNFAHLATLMPDGTPHLTPVWVDIEDGHVIINTAEGRLKPRNLRRDPRVAVEVSNQENPYEHVSIRGRAVDEDTGEEADRHIDRMAQKYLGQDTYPFRQPGEKRIMFRIEPERVTYSGG